MLSSSKTMTAVKLVIISHNVEEDIVFSINTLSCMSSKTQHSLNVCLGNEISKENMIFINVNLSISIKEHLISQCKIWAFR